MPDLNYDLSRDYIRENAVKDINEAHPNWEIVTHLLDAISWWLQEMDIDGFRLDVPDEVPFWFWELFRQKVKSIKADAWLVGELWNHAEQWVNSKYFDSIMNYANFKDPVIDYFFKGIIGKDTFLQRIFIGLETYPLCSLHAMMNLMDSHDTWRINEIVNGKTNAVKLAVLFQMTYIGTPHIYHGDEIGMLGAKDPDNRRPFNWHWQDRPEAVDLHDYYKALIALRKANRVLQKGMIRFIRHDELFIMERFDTGSRIQVIINNTDTKVEYDLAAESYELLFSSQPNEHNYYPQIIFVPALTGVIIKLS
jgi:glycosidase